MTSHNGSLKNSRSSATKTLRTLWNFVKRHRNIILLILSIVLIVRAIDSVNLLITNAYTDFFTCDHLIDGTLKGDPLSLCEGVDLQIGPWNVPFIGRIGPFPTTPIVILPGLDVIDPPLEAVRKFVVWNIILAFAVVSLVLAFIASKIKDFVTLLRTPAGRKAILTNLNLWLLIFAIFCTLFYFKVVVPSFEK